MGELAELELAVSEAIAGHPILVLLGGDSGVGKTRLVGELEQRLAGQEIRVLRGEGVEQGEGELPYAPLVGALRPLVRECHPALTALTPGSRAQLAAVIPGLGDGAASQDREDPSGQLRLFEALLELLADLSAQEPVVLVLEDMHWADRSTRTFVAFLARSLRQERLCIVFTYRTDELHRRHALRPLLSELERLERARRVEVAPFDRDELTEALEDILGDTPSSELVERLYARSEGNPLFTEELLAAGLDGRGAAPQSLRDAFLLRIERLSGDGQRAVRAVAVGRALDEATLAEVTGIEHSDLQAALREAVSEQILMADEDHRLRFRHALLREAVIDDLLPGERGELHLALARTLEARLNGGADQQVMLAASIAGHYAASGDQPAALRATVRAARAAEQVHAYGEAADLAERGLELWPRVSGAQELVGIDHVRLLTLAASAHGIAGDMGRAEVLWRSALDELDPASDRRRYSRLLARLARIQWSLNRGVEGVDTAQRALEMLPDDEPTRERALLLGWLARRQYLRGRFRDALRDGEEALAAALAAGDRQAEGEVRNTLGMTQVALGRVDEGVAQLWRAIEIAREDEDPDSVTTAYSNLADVVNLAGRTREALEIAQEGLAGTSRHFTRNYDWMTLTVCGLSIEVGDWRAAREHLELSRSRLVGVALIFRLLTEAELELAVGNDELAGRCLAAAEALVASSSEPQWIGAFGALLGELRRRAWDLDGARDAVARALDRIEVCTDDVARIARVSAVGARIEADAAQRARDLREKATERNAVARARIHAQRLTAAAQDGGPVERALRVIGAAELARARGKPDPVLWLRAAREWDALARPYPAGVSRWRAAEAYVEVADRKAASEAAQEAHQCAKTLGSTWLEQEITGLAYRARLELAQEACDVEHAGSNGAGEDPFGLTPRERQVLSLIAQGATNRQIGSALFMAEKTASVHVSRILSKLGVQSRTQAAAVAHRMHLA